MSGGACAVAARQARAAIAYANTVGSGMPDQALHPLHRPDRGCDGECSRGCGGDCDGGCSPDRSRTARGVKKRGPGCGCADCNLAADLSVAAIAYAAQFGDGIADGLAGLVATGRSWSSRRHVLTRRFDPSAGLPSRSQGTFEGLWHRPPTDQTAPDVAGSDPEQHFTGLGSPGSLRAGWNERNGEAAAEAMADEDGRALLCWGLSGLANLWVVVGTTASFSLYVVSPTVEEDPSAEDYFGGRETLLRVDGVLTVVEDDPGVRGGVRGSLTLEFFELEVGQLRVLPGAPGEGVDRGEDAMVYRGMYELHVKGQFYKPYCEFLPKFNYAVWDAAGERVADEGGILALSVLSECSCGGLAGAVRTAFMSALLVTDWTAAMDELLQGDVSATQVCRWLGGCASWTNGIFWLFKLGCREGYFDEPTGVGPVDDTGPREPEPS